MNEYEELFRAKALHGFDLIADDYVRIVDSIPYDSNIIANLLVYHNQTTEHYAERWLYSKGVHALTKLLNLYMDIIQNPSELTKHEFVCLDKMKRYLTENAGHSYGYFKYRKEWFQHQCELFIQLSLSMKMEIIANQDVLVNDLCDKIKQLEYVKETNNSLNTYISQEKYKPTKLRWANKVVMCQCGTEYKQSNRFNHLKTNKHKQFIHNLCYSGFSKQDDPVTLQVIERSLTQNLGNSGELGK